MTRRNPGPTGPAYPITRQWQEAVRSRMDELSWSQYDLAKAIGCTQPAIAWVLRPLAKQSSLVPKIHKALGMAKPELPGTGLVAPKLAQAHEMLEGLTDEELNHIIATARMITRNRTSD